jgi:hypothetical protein
LPILGDGAHLHPEGKKNGRRVGAQTPLLPKLGHGALEATKKMKKGGASSFLVESWQWCLTNNKKKQKKKRSSFCAKSW